MKKLKDFRKLDLNPMSHTDSGGKELELSIEHNGYTEPMVSAVDGVILSGNDRFEKVQKVMPVDPIIVESDGSRPIIVVRTDVESDSPKAKRIILASNRVQTINNDPNQEIIDEYLKILENNGEWIGSGYNESDYEQIEDQLNQELQKAGSTEFLENTVWYDEDGGIYTYISSYEGFNDKNLGILEEICKKLKLEVVQGHGLDIHIDGSPDYGQEIAFSADDLPDPDDEEDYEEED